MRNADEHRRPRFYFALPRLLWSLLGGDARRTENNGMEANTVGTLTHLCVYAFAFELCLASHPLWQQLLFALPLTLLVWLFWINLVYANSWVIKLLRACGLLHDLPQGRAQSILIGLTTTALAFRLLEADGWTRVVGAIWIAAVALNLFAAAVLALIQLMHAPVD